MYRRRNRNYHQIGRALKAAFPKTIPVMLGYLFVGMAFGMLLQDKGYSFWWAFLMSVVVYAGSMQFVAINLLTSAAGFFEAAMITLMVNFRHVFYGLSFIDRFSRMGRKKPYMIFSLTDETYSLLFSAKPPPRVDEDWFAFFIALLNQCYWIIGSLLGALARSYLTFNSQGIDFAMTALFVVIFIEQWQSSPTHIPAWVGLVCCLFCILLFGTDHFILPTLLMILALLMALRKPIEKETARAQKKEG